jgi:tetratricopeptide (TPR) repeat protein
MGRVAILAAGAFLVAACGSEAPAPAPAPTSAAPETVKKAALVKLKIDPSVPERGAMIDQSEATRKRDPWDNFKTHDPLQVNFIQWNLGAKLEQYKKDFVGTLLRQGVIDFQLIAAFYREGLLSRDKRGEQVQVMLDAIAKAGDDPALKTHLVVALTHIGFEEQALELADKWKAEPWFGSSWDANFYTGSLLFRYGRYADAVPYLEAALELTPDPWTRLWLRLAMHDDTSPEAAAKREKLFTFGPHMGTGDPSAFPFENSADAWGFGSWGLAGAVAFQDFDGDSYIDMMLQGVYASPEYYRYEPKTGFARISDKAIEAISNTPASCLAADFDNDGFVDLFSTSAAWFGAGPNRLLKNLGGKGFVEVKETGDLPLLDQNSVGSSALDYDKDGLLDIVVSGSKGGTARLLRNKGGMVFEETTKAAGLLDTWYPSIHLTSGDVNGDGWPDIFVNAIGGTNRLYINKGDGTFSEEGEKRGVAQGTPVGFSTWMFDYDNDGDLDIVAANFAMSGKKFLGGFGSFPPESFSVAKPPVDAFQPSALYKNDGTGHFENVSIKAGFTPSSVMGGQFMDIDLDGDLDIIFGPGSHPLENMQPLFVYRNDGNDRFTNITPVGDPRYYGKFHGMAFADVDRDGDPDLYVNNGGVLLSDRWRDMFLENKTEGAHWLHLKLEGTKSNRSAIGARVAVHVGDRVLTQEVAAGQAFGSTNSPYLIFGLAAAEAVDSVHITWPSTTKQTLAPLAADQALIVTEGSDVLRRVY